MKGAEAGKAFAVALAQDTVLQELDLSGGKARNDWDPVDVNRVDVNFTQEVAVGLGANGALVKFDISNNNLYAAGGRALAEGLRGNQVVKELNIAGNYIGMEDWRTADNKSGVIAISDAIPTMGALTSLNISNNRIGYGRSDGVKALAEAIKGHVSARWFD
jgi:hypothetical protein